jgi:hypothetical protein
MEGMFSFGPERPYCPTVWKLVTDIASEKVERVASVTKGSFKISCGSSPGSETRHSASSILASIM